MIHPASNRPSAPTLAPCPLVALVALVVAVCACWPGPLRAQQDNPTLKPSRVLQEKLPPALRRQLPSFVSGDWITGRPDLDLVIDGNAELRRGDTVLRADRLQYDQVPDLAQARGQVYLNRAGDIYQGPLLELEIDAMRGFFTQPSYRLLKNDAYGEASRIDFIDDQHAVMRDASFTTCQRRPGPDWLPDWILRAERLNVDNELEIARAEGALLRFKDIPILPVPEFDFPIGNKRKTGFLSPTLGLDNVNGVEITTPYYLNLAAQRDLTLWPTVMSKRGIDLGVEYRYLEPTNKGQVRADLMPSDSLRSRSRWGLAALHNDSIASPIGPLALNLNLNRVSDNDYWRDFPRAGASLTQRLLVSEVGLTWGTAYLRTLKWQTLQDPSAPITPPYDRLPQLGWRYLRSNLDGYDLSLEADLSRFEGDRSLTGQVNGWRGLTLLQLSRPWLSPAGFITPKLQWHVTRYRFDDPLSNGATSASRALPTFSLDSGLVFERDASFFERPLRQTLEPRAFYVYTPFRDQHQLPNYDSAANDFNFATVFTENAFGGNDRIADNNLLTLGVTSRLLEPNSGAELARFGLAQRLRFKDQNVTLPGGSPVQDRFSDLLLGATLNWEPRWTLDSTWQYNLKTRASERNTLGARYSPGNYRVISAAYRFQRAASEQIDVSWQWPLADLWGDRSQDLGPGRGLGEQRWYSVGRMNYSLQDRKLVDAIAGFEYDAGCWIGRVVLERLQSSQTAATRRLLLQLEFVGFSRLGANPIRSLRENIPRYQNLREQIVTPSRFTRYD